MLELVHACTQHPPPRLRGAPTSDASPTAIVMRVQAPRKVRPSGQHECSPDLFAGAKLTQSMANSNDMDHAVYPGLPQHEVRGVLGHDAQQMQFVGLVKCAIHTGLVKCVIHTGLVKCAIHKRMHHVGPVRRNDGVATLTQRPLRRHVLMTVT